MLFFNGTDKSHSICNFLCFYEGIDHRLMADTKRDNFILIDPLDHLCRYNTNDNDIMVYVLKRFIPVIQRVIRAGRYVFNPLNFRHVLIVEEIRLAEILFRNLLT